MGPEDFKERLVELAACEKAIAAAQVGAAFCCSSKLCMCLWCAVGP